jgi:hypothetical protein
MSEVVYFREQQALSEEAARRGLSGFAVCATHESITARMERGAERILRLIEAGRHEDAQALMNTEWYSEQAEAQEADVRARTGATIDTQELEEGARA